MANKRRLIIRSRGALDPEDDAQGLILEDDGELSWKEWFVQVYALYLFVIFCFWLVIMIILSLRWDMGLDYSLAIPIGIIFILPMYLVYRRIWVGKRRRVTE